MIVLYFQPYSALTWFTATYIYSLPYLYSSIFLISYFIYSYDITFYTGPDNLEINS